MPRSIFYAKADLYFRINIFNTPLSLLIKQNGKFTDDILLKLAVNSNLQMLILKPINCIKSCKIIYLLRIMMILMQISTSVAFITIDFHKTFPVSDLLHLLKSMRRKILNHLIKMTNTSPYIDIKTEMEILKLLKYYHKLIESKQPLDTMKDNLALMILNTENLILFGLNRRFQFFILLFVEILILTVIQAKNCPSNVELIYV